MTSLMHHRRGFTLVELLTVVAIIVVVLTLSLPAMRNLATGTDLVRAASLVSDNLNGARQMALARNKQIEVRFYNYSDPSQAETTSFFRALQVFEVPETGTMSGKNAVTKLLVLPPSMIMDSGNKSGTSDLSTLLDNPAPIKGSSGDTTTPPAISGTYTYSYVDFFPNGKTGLPITGANSTWHLTVHAKGFGDPIASTSKTLRNWIAIQIIPDTGQVRTFRPE